MKRNQYFTHQTIPDKKNKIHIVVEHYSAEHQKIIGVITGVESVCVINAGLGMTGDIRKYVEDILGTDKTIECVSLTGQPSDTGALAPYDVAYISDGEKKVYDEVGTNDDLRRAQFAQLALGNKETIAYGEKLFLSNKGISFKPAGDGISQGKQEVGPHMFDKQGDGYMFHLGGTVVELASLPAQSDDQLVALGATCCIHFMGKALEPVTRLESRDRAGLEKYAECLQRVYDYTTKPSAFSEGMGFTAPVYYGDSSVVPMTAEGAGAILYAVREVLDGKTDYDIPADTEGNLRVHFNGNYGIVYDPAKLAQ